MTIDIKTYGGKPIRTSYTKEIVGYEPRETVITIRAVAKTPNDYKAGVEHQLVWEEFLDQLR